MNLSKGKRFNIQSHPNKIANSSTSTDVLVLVFHTSHAKAPLFPAQEAIIVILNVIV